MTRRGRAGKWIAKKIRGNEWVAENGVRTEHISGAHCKACLFVYLITRYGGDVDLRGLSAFGICYQFLAFTVRVQRHPEPEDLDGDDGPKEAA